MRRIGGKGLAFSVTPQPVAISGERCLSRFCEKVPVYSKSEHHGKLSACSCLCPQTVSTTSSFHLYCTYMRIKRKKKKKIKAFHVDYVLAVGFSSERVLLM